MRAGTVKQCLFGSALVNIRESLQISQYQLAKRTGIAEEYLHKLENSKREPKARMIIRLGRGLGVSPGDLLNEMDRLMRLEEDE
ncbi:helix-turn-helix domain-containing protein [Bilophila wadsworthia]|uniref:helix-turn-helix domain-containing protein n=1 Tax=Bilophila wadsworthia TaxID=35833 RepID=UPI00243036A5|nr:helix-turn-helix transcriptional regulator [Bilophila wadsworthia]